ncbi:hypothetical protein G6F56_000147 [Rhizopus delemar]|nr:hypothetical protein G6F56_000147 [Rhizopus delemar]
MLQQKLIPLVTMATMWRPRPDIRKLQYQDILFVQDDQGKLEGVTLKARAPKEIKPKKIKVSAQLKKQTSAQFRRCGYSVKRLKS